MSPKSLQRRQHDWADVSLGGPSSRDSGDGTQKRCQECLRMTIKVNAIEPRQSTPTLRECFRRSVQLRVIEAGRFVSNAHCSQIT